MKDIRNSYKNCYSQEVPGYTDENSDATLKKLDGKMHSAYDVSLSRQPSQDCSDYFYDVL